jgi:predicted Zn-dependent peptidase
MMDLLGQLLLDPVTEDGAFSRDFIRSEKKNLISTIESELNDKRAYAAGQLMRTMCREDSFGVPRLGDKESVEAIEADTLFAHYRKILQESPVELFYVGSAAADTVAQLLRPLFAGGQRTALPVQTPFHSCEGTHSSEEMDVTQAKLCLGFVTPITNRSPEFAAMQVFNVLYGAGMTSKLFMNVREKLSLCYAIGSGYHGSKGILTVSAGIDTDKEALTRQEILAQLEACRTGDFTAQELASAKEAILSSIRSVHDSPGAIESYYSTSALSGARLTLQEYRAAVEATTAEEVARAARSVSLHSSFILKGVSA